MTCLFDVCQAGGPRHSEKKSGPHFKERDSSLCCSGPHTVRTTRTESQIKSNTWQCEKRTDSYTQRSWIQMKTQKQREMTVSGYANWKCGQAWWWEVRVMETWHVSITTTSWVTVGPWWDLIHFLSSQDTAGGVSYSKRPGVFTNTLRILCQLLSGDYTVMTFHSEALTRTGLVFQSPTASFPSTVKTGFVCPAEEDFPKGKWNVGKVKVRLMQRRMKSCMRVFLMLL